MATYSGLGVSGADSINMGVLGEGTGGGRRGNWKGGCRMLMRGVEGKGGREGVERWRKGKGGNQNSMKGGRGS